MQSTRPLRVFASFAATATVVVSLNKTYRPTRGFLQGMRLPPRSGKPVRRRVCRRNALRRQDVRYSERCFVQPDAGDDYGRGTRKPADVTVWVSADELPSSPASATFEMHAYDGTPQFLAIKTQVFIVGTEWACVTDIEASRTMAREISSTDPMIMTPH